MSESVHLFFDDLSDVFSFGPPSAWTTEPLGVDRASLAKDFTALIPDITPNHVHYTRPELRSAGESTNVTLDYADIAADSSVELYGRQYTVNATGSPTATSDLVVSYRPSSGQDVVHFESDAFISVDFGVVVAGKDAALDQAKIIVDDEDTSEVVYFGNWRSDQPAMPSSTIDGALIVNGSGSASVGPHIPYKFSTTSASEPGSGFKFRFLGHTIEVYGCYTLQNPQTTMNVSFALNSPNVKEPDYLHTPMIVFDPARGNDEEPCTRKRLLAYAFPEPKEFILTANITGTSSPSATLSLDYILYKPAFSNLSQKPVWDLNELKDGKATSSTFTPRVGALIGASVAAGFAFLVIVFLVVMLKFRRGRKGKVEDRVSTIPSAWIVDKPRSLGLPALLLGKGSK